MESHQIGPPAWLLAVTRLLTPAGHRNNVEETLREAGLSRFQSVVHTPRFIAGSICGNMWDAVNVVTILAEILVLYAAFSPAPLLPFLIVCASALLTFRMRDAYAHPATCSPREAIADAAIAAALIIAVQSGIRFLAPELALPDRLLFPEIVIAVSSISLLRMIFNRRSMFMQRESPSDVFYSRAWQINILYIAGVMAVLHAGIDAVPATTGGRDFFLGAFPIVAFTFAFTNAWRRNLQVGGNIEQTILRLEIEKDLQPDVLRTKQMLLAGPKRGSLAASRWDSFWMASGLLSPAVPLIDAFRLWMTGHPSAVHVDWPQLWPILLSHLLLLALFIFIKDLNEAAGRAIQKDIQELSETEAQ